MNEQKIEIVWHPDPRVNDVIAASLVTLDGLGKTPDQVAAEDPNGYVRLVCKSTAAFLGTLPALRRAAQMAGSGFTPLQCAEEVIRALCSALMVPAEPILAELNFRPLAEVDNQGGETDGPRGETLH